MAETDNVPAWTGKPGQYEVWFLTMSDGASGYWIRYTLLHPTAGPGEARLWFARFDRDDPSKTFGVNRAFPLEDFRAEREPFEVHAGGGVLRSGHAQGSIVGGGHDVSWLVDFETGGPTYRLLPDALYRGGLAPTKPFSPNVATTFSGRITIDGQTYTLAAMPGQQGHLYGAKHAERWAWAHCNAYEDDSVLHAIVAQGRRGPVTMPFTAFAGLRWRDRWIRLRGVSRRRPFWLGGWRVDLSDKRYRLTGRVAGDPAFMIQAVYHDPDGTPRYCHNTEVASSRFVLFERGDAGFEEVAVLSSEGTTHAEWAGRTPAPGEFIPHLDVTT
jgi:hypothetical protein